MILDGISYSSDQMISFLMVGQSNMSGRGDLCEVEPILNEKCFVMRMGRWQKMCEPINYDRSLNAEFLPGACLATSFADAVQKHTGAPVGLIPCADGGTTVQQWQPGDVLFDHAVFMARLAMRTSRLCGILWHQGESDCNPFHPDDYREKLLNVMNRLREQLGAHIPIIMGEISENTAQRWAISENAPKMNRLIHSVSEMLPRSAVAEAKELALRCDGIHFSAPSLRTLGKRYFEKFIEIK
jgi:hypothetical protein